MIYKEYIDLITNIDLFKTVPRRELEHLFALGNYNISDYKKGQIIHLPNEICTTMDLVLRGKVSAQNIDKDGNILTVTTFNPSDILGVSLIFATKNSYPMTIIADSNCTLVHIHEQLILELCQSNMGFLERLIGIISDKSLTLTSKLNSISLKTIRECLIDFLKYEYHIQRTNVIKLHTTKKEMAERLGVQRPSLSRELNKMKKDGLVDYDAKTITIKDMNIIGYKY